MNLPGNEKMQQIHVLKML